VKLAGRLRKALRGLEGAELELANEDKGSKIMVEIRSQQTRLREKLILIAGEKVMTAHDEEQRARFAGVSKTSSTMARVPQVGSMTNEQLAHELLLDKNFRLDDKSGMSEDKLVHTKIRETFERAFWESLEEDISSSPPSYRPVLSVLAEIKSGIETLCAGHAEAHTIGEIIDVDLITEQLKSHALRHEGCLDLVDATVRVLLSIHDRMKSPERHRETAEKWAAMRQTMTEGSDTDLVVRARFICAALEFVLDRVHTLRVDTANNKLKAIAPVIREHGIDYEKSHFNKKIEKKMITLNRTKAWIAHTVFELRMSNDPRAPLPDLVKGKAEVFEFVLHFGIVNLVAEFPSWGGLTRDADQEDQIPETLLLDLLRVKSLNTHFHTDVVSSTMLVTVESKLRENVMDLHARNKLLGAVQGVVMMNPPKHSPPTNTLKLVMHELVDAMPSNQLSSLQILMERNIAKTSPVYLSMSKIMKKVWVHIVKDHKIEPSQVSSSGLPVCAHCLVSEVVRHTSCLSDVAALNKKVHVTRYNELIKSAVEIVAHTD
jgi:T-complex protein 11